MQYRHLYPMVRLLLPFMAGIAVCVIISASTLIPYILWVSILLLTLAAALIPSRSVRFIKRWLFGVLLSLFLFVTGFNSVLIHKEILQHTHFSKILNQGTFIAMVSEPLQEKEHSFKSILTVRGIKKGSTILPAEGRILTYFAKDSTMIPPEEGSTVIFSGTVQEIAPPQNPGAFNYRKYMAAGNVHHQVYLSTYSWKILKNQDNFSLTRYAHSVSRKFVSILKDNGLKGKEFGVASALILGQNDLLDNEIRQVYSGSGVSHILSVSGLHVGVIYIIISFLLGFMKKEGKQLYLKTALILLTIWAYALLTGMSPPVMRAAVMFTFISIGNASRRNVHIINSLAVSAFVLLLINPLLISNTGFQLSYLAIVGIVFINKPIAGLLNPSNKIASKVWSLIAVSLAAQIATAPLTMLYFHQFPIYFIPANLIAVPLSFLAIYSGVAVLVTSALPAISNFFGLVTNLLLYIMNYSLGFIEQLPYAVQQINFIFKKEMILLYMIIMSLILFFSWKRKGLLYLTLVLVLLLSVSMAITETMRQQQQKIIFYSSNKQSAIGFINGKEQLIIADSVLIKDKASNKFQFEGAKLLFGISTNLVVALDTLAEYNQLFPEKTSGLYSFGKNLMFHSKRIIIVDSIPKLSGNLKKLRVDYLVIRNNPKFHINDLKKLYQPGLIIIDGSNSNYKTDKWITECKTAGLKVHGIRNQGAYIVDL